MALNPGTNVGPYEVIGTLGAGGMGEVYRARDTKLGRSVALKVLPDLFATDPERLARFTREAQVLASLNHPNIAAIYGLEGQALVMELVEGDDLSAIIARGPMPLADALPIARQIADAIEAAHEQGIIHRDLKPGNVKVRADGTVKVLDFGLAKAMDRVLDSGPGTLDAANSPTLTIRGTQMGMIIGTAAYMSPEQARGKAVDRRADVWAFGAIVYEMLTGKRAFDPSAGSGSPRAAPRGEGDTVQDVLTSVLRDDPNWTALPGDLPASVTRLLRRCLEKDPKRRLSAIGDARLELEERDEPNAAATVVPGSRATGRATFTAWLLPMAVGAALAAIVAFAIWPRAAGDAAAGGSALARLSILPPPGQTVYPDSTGVAMSPDGTMVAFVIGNVNRSEGELWVRSLDSMAARRLDSEAGVSLPFWSPDSTRIAYFTNTKLKTIAAAGGRAEVLADAPGARGGFWAASNTIVFAPDAGGPLMKVSATGGTPAPATTLDSARKEYGHRFPAPLPDGDRFLYASLPGRDGKFEIFAGSLTDDSRVLIGAMEAAPVYADPGWLLYARQGVLNALPFDPRTLEVTGDPIRFEDEPSAILDPAVSFTAGRSVSLSATGAMAYYSAPSLNTIATWYDASGAPAGALNVPPGHYEGLAISPDGVHAVLVQSVSPSESSLWLVDLARGGASRLSTGAGRNDGPVWSPDGARVVWASDRTGPQNLYIKNLNDAAPEQLLWGSDVPFKGPVAWSPDGSRIVLVQLDRDTAQNLYLLDATGKTPLTPFVIGPTRDPAAAVSPDGHWFAYPSDESGRFQLYAQPFPGPGRKVQVSERGATTAWWSRDSRQLTYVSDDFRSLWRVPMTPGATMTAGAPRQIATLPPDIIFIAMMPDESRFLALSPERTGTGSITVVQNWRAALR
jgi:Tol biopolymer transport system component